ncbi:MAG: T9SS type A sorting domain-containing protein, partial [Oceanihabitans sp.]|nr:T9SS type A sorting domain-containing protein [Oceanihabitans sp.]
ESLSIDEVDFNNHLKYYPNPTSNIVTIANTSYLIESIKVYNMQGQLLLDNKQTSANNIIIDFSDFSKGMYVVYVNDSSVLKIIRN